MKTCPVCGSGAFDDAEVCYGCLHRYGSGSSQGGLSLPRPVAPAARQVSSACDGAADSGFSVQPKNEAVAASGVTGVSAEEGAVPVRAGGLADEGARDAARGLGVAEGASWTLRFEFPGFAPVSCSAGRHEGAAAGCVVGSADGEAAAGSSESKNDACGFIVRFQPDAPRDEGARRRPSHASHVRASMIDSRMLSPTTEKA